MAATEVQEMKDMAIDREKLTGTNKVSPLEESGESLPGAVNQGFEGQLTDISNTAGLELNNSELPPLTYVDFMPRCIGQSLDGKEPEFASYRTVMEQVNQWLISMPQYKIFKVETIDRKLLGEMKLDLDSTLQHESSHGQNMYVRGIRIWIFPNPNPSDEVQQISYISILPDVSEGNSADVSLALSANYRMRAEHPVPAYDTLKITIEKLNRQLQHRPLAGKILNIETFSVKVVEGVGNEKPDTESSCWIDSNRSSRLFLYALRVYYITGQQQFETIGYHDEVPDIVQTSEGLGVKVKYAPFTQVVSRTARWIQEQTNVQVVNLQSINIPTEKRYGGQINFKSNISGYGELPLSDSQFVKILRTFYVTKQKSKNDEVMPSVNLTTRLFVPIRRGPKEFEAFSKTMQRAIAWLQVTKCPLYGMETVNYVIHYI
ncbi:uncharacterized protein LOC126810668 [Patella vulgata]|uniref:uncharacterized protein LOC126810668 n=1 Tax=Patella vulgata TaxID=6465 RepID=UPI0021808B61|nr:uncharacterized protein LOC126810668 [Patella vulgata]